MDDLVYIPYNQALKLKYKLCNTIDPISLKDIDDSLCLMMIIWDGNSKAIGKKKDSTWQQEWGH